MPQRPIEQRKGHRRVDPAAEEHQHLAVSHLLLSPGDGLLDELLHGPSVLKPAQADKVFQHLLALHRVPDLRMKLQGKDRTLRVPQRRVGSRMRLSEALKLRRQDGHAVLMAHPDLTGRRDTVPERALLQEVKLGLAKLSMPRVLDLPPEFPGNQLVSIAQPQDRHVQRQQLPIECRGVFCKDRGRTSGEHEPSHLPEILQRGVGREDLGIRSLVADALGDQVSVLAAEVQNGDAGIRHLRLLSLQDINVVLSRSAFGAFFFQAQVFMFGIGLPEMVIIVVVALIFIGPQQLPEVMRTLGRGLVQLKRATNDIRSTVQDEMNQIEKELDTKELRELKDVKDEVQNTIGNVTSTFNPLQGRQADGEKLVDLANAMEGKPAESPSTSSSGEKQEAASTETSETAPDEAPSSTNRRRTRSRAGSDTGLGRRTL